MRKRIDLAEPWYRFIGELDWLLNDCSYLAAVGTLMAIRETVLRSRRVTDGQRRALESIRERVEAA